MVTTKKLTLKETLILKELSAISTWCPDGDTVMLELETISDLIGVSISGTKEAILDLIKAGLVRMHGGQDEEPCFSKI